MIAQLPCFTFPYLLDRKTSVFVGRISPSVDNETILKILEVCSKLYILIFILQKCGAVETWKRLDDAKTKQYKPFGFCDYQTVDSAMRAIRLLNELDIGGQKLQVKVDEKTKTFMGDYEKRKIELWARWQQDKFEELQATDVKVPVDPALLTTQVPLPYFHVREADKESWYQQVMKEDSIILQLVDDIITGRDTSKSETIAKRLKGELAAVQNTVARIAKEAPDEAEQKKEFLASSIRKFRELEVSREREKTEREKDKERHREREKRRQLDREALKEKERMKYFESEKDRERKRKERELRDLERNEREREMYIERMQKELTAGSLYEQYTDSHRRGKKRYRSSDSDSDEERKRWRKLIRREKERYYFSQMEVDGDSDKSDDEKKPLFIPLEAKIVPPPPPPPKGPEDANVSNFFNPDEYEDENANKKKHMHLLDKIDYKELKRMEQEEKRKKDEEYKKRMEEQTKKRAEAEKKEQWKRERLDPLLIAKSIPNDKPALFAFEMKWSLVDQYNIVDRRLKQFVASKIRELLDTDEPSLVEFVVSKLKLHCKPDDLEKELQDVLMDDTEQFMLKLWKMLVFEVLKTQGELDVYGTVKVE